MDVLDKILERILVYFRGILVEQHLSYANGLFLLNLGLNVENGTDFSAAVKVEKAKNEDQLVVSSIDFVGLDFGDKKRTRGLPPGLVPVADTFSDQDIKEVEIIVGDTSKFENPTATKPEPVKEDNSETYKPKVSTWGVFPRPSNISRTVHTRLLNLHTV